VLHAPLAQLESLSPPLTIGGRCVMAPAFFAASTERLHCCYYPSRTVRAALSAAWWLFAEHAYVLCAGVQAFLLRKLKLNGSMGLALKLQPILDAAAPRAKL